MKKKLVSNNIHKLMLAKGQYPFQKWQRYDCKEYLRDKEIGSSHICGKNENRGWQSGKVSWIFFSNFVPT